MPPQFPPSVADNSFHIFSHKSPTRKKSIISNNPGVSSRETWCEETVLQPCNIIALHTEVRGTLHIAGNLEISMILNFETFRFGNCDPQSNF